MAKINVIAMAYNEEFLMPFFLKHYEWVDYIHIILDTDSTDKTEEIARSHPKVIIHDFAFPDGMDDILKIKKINRFYRTLPPDEWAILVDIDELIFHPDLMTNPRKAMLESNPLPVNYAGLFEVWRHHTDKDLDPGKPPLLQRRHGVPDIGISYNLNSPYFIKPIIVKTGMALIWSPGCHDVATGVENDETIVWHGAHWCMADPCFALTRRLHDRRDRQSESNLSRRMTHQHHNINEWTLRREFEKHLNDPLLF